MGHNNLVPNNVHGNVIYGGGGGGGGPGGGTGGGYIGGVTFKRDERALSCRRTPSSPSIMWV